MQLEHCPFCGTDHALMPDASGRYQQIVCGSCGARGPEVYRFLPYSTAAQSWNVRQSGPTDGNTTHRAHGIIGAPGVTTCRAGDPTGDKGNCACKWGGADWRCERPSGVDVPGEGKT